MALIAGPTLTTEQLLCRSRLSSHMLWMSRFGIKSDKYLIKLSISFSKTFGNCSLSKNTSMKPQGSFHLKTKSAASHRLCNNIALQSSSSLPTYFSSCLCPPTTMFAFQPWNARQSKYIFHLLVKVQSVSLFTSILNVYINFQYPF